MNECLELKSTSPKKKKMVRKNSTRNKVQYFNDEKCWLI